MLIQVKRINKFIDDLLAVQLDNATEQSRICLVEYFSKKNAEDVLIKADIGFLLDQFNLRSNRIKNTSEDYIFNLDGVNALWIELAIDLAPIMEKNYPEVLVPGGFSSLIPTENTILNQCKQMLLSLFIIDFKCSKSIRTTISICDKKHQVFDTAATLYNSLAPSIRSDDYPELLKIYSEQLDSTIIPYSSSPSNTGGLWAFFTGDSNSVSIDWSDNVKNGTLDNMDVHWFDPKLLIHTLVHFRTVDVTLEEQINVFVDELIHTYSQDFSKLEKQVRVNILFSELMRTINKNSEFKSLKLFLDLNQRYEYKNKFLANCAEYIVSRMEKIVLVKQTTISSIFSVPFQLTLGQIKIQLDGLLSVSDVIEAYKKELRSNKPNIDPELYKKLLKYLQKFCSPLLTYEEEYTAAHSERFSDPLGAHT
jgi:hypothetical protein